MTPALKLSVHFGERDRVAGGFTADALLDAFARLELRASVLLRGVEGFGLRHPLRTARLLTLSEDLPMLAIAVDAPDRIEAALEEVGRLSPNGLVTLERSRLVDAAGGVPALSPNDEAKLTVYAGRRWRGGRRAAHLDVVAALHDHGVAGATTLLGVDGTLGGRRARARFLSANRHVPTMTIAVGGAARVVRALGDVHRLAPDAVTTLERVRVCKRDGAWLAAPWDVPDRDADGLGLWHRLTVYTGEQSRNAGVALPLYAELIRALRGGGALGATAVRGIWGYHGDHRPHGDTLLQLRRRVPVLVVCVDRASRTAELFAIVDRLTRGDGLVTSELVPAFRAGALPDTVGGLRLARPPGPAFGDPAVGEDPGR